MKKKQKQQKQQGLYTYQYPLTCITQFAYNKLVVFFQMTFHLLVS